MTIEEDQLKAIEALQLVHDFWIHLAEQVESLEETEIQSLAIRHATLCALVRNGIREHQLIRAGTITNQKEEKQ